MMKDVIDRLCTALVATTDADPGARRNPHLADPADDRPPAPRLWHRVLTVLPALLLTTIVGVDIGTGQIFHGIPWVVLVPGLAALVCSLRATVAYAVLTVLVHALVAGAQPSGALTGLAGFLLVAISAAGAVFASAARLSVLRQTDHIREIAETTRRTVLRPLPSSWAGLEQAAVYTTADTAARVGGDFYDIQPSPYGTRLVLGDVQGKGLDAVSCASALVGSFREAAFHEQDLTDVAVRMDQRLRRHQQLATALGGDEAERFATAALINVPTDTPPGPLGTEVELVNCGHLDPLAVGPHGVRELTGRADLPLGLLGLTGAAPARTRVTLRPDETLLLVSDGVTEARDADGAFYPLTEDLTAALRTDPALAEPRRLVRHVRAAAARHAAQGLTDDTTVLAVRRPEPTAGPRPVDRPEAQLLGMSTESMM
jgi:hypothetical protein